MKKILLLLISISPLLMSNESIPEKLLLSSKAFTDNPYLYPVYRIDLIIFSHTQINEKDKQERFPQLEKFIYSDDLLQLHETPHLLVNREAIKDGLIPNTQVIKSIDLNSQLMSINTQEEAEVEVESTKTMLPYEYFELIDDKNSPTKKFAKRLNTRKNYEVLFEGSWFQPLFNQEISSPIFISNENNFNGIHGELLLYKERFLHSNLKIRLSERTNEEQSLSTINLYNFNSLLKLSKVNNRFVSFFKSLGEDVISFSSWIFRTKEFSPVLSSKESYLLINSNYKDLFEINQQTKMKEDTFHYVDHPYFGAVIRVSQWEMP
ncbi:MAG: CsiV family protein [SAR86 cluster bacterium]